MAWVDLKQAGFALMRAEVDGHVWIAVRVSPDAEGYDSTPIPALRNARFIQIKENFWVRDSLLKLDELRAVFPHFEQREGESPSTLTKSEYAALKGARTIGTNMASERIIEQNGVRFATNEYGFLEREAEDPSQGEPGRFLRAVDQESLHRTASTLVAEMFEGRMVSFSRLEAVRDASALPGEEPRFTLRDFQEAVEAAQSRVVTGIIANKEDGPDSAVFGDVQGIHERQPAFSARTSTQVALQQFSTPAPLAVALQVSLKDHLNAALGAGRPYKVYEPTVGHGALISVLAGVAAREDVPIQFHVNELDANRLDRLTAAYSSLENVTFHASKRDAALTDAPVDDLDLVITNPPFGNLSGYSVEVQEETRTRYGRVASRIDQAIALRAMEGLRPGGRGIMILAADSYMPRRARQVQNISRRFYDHLEENFHIDGVAEVEGRLYAKSGASFPVRLVVVTKPDPRNGILPGNVRIPDELPGLGSWREIMGFSRALTTGKAAAVLQMLGDRQTAQRADREAARAANDAVLKQERVETIATPLDDMRRLIGGVGEGEPESEFTPDAGNDAAEGGRSAGTQDIDEGIREVEEAEANNWQTPYVPASRLGQSNVVVPTYLKEPMERALARVGRDYEDGVDEFVATRLSATYDELQERYLPHQIDLLALGIDATDKGGAIIVADQTGMGKGRGLAGISDAQDLQLPVLPDGTRAAPPPPRAAGKRRRGKHLLPEETPTNLGGTVIFVTEKPHLATDFVRDLTDIDAIGKVYPLIVNEDRSDIVDQDGNLLFEYDPQKMDRALKEQSFLGANVIFLTYSQLGAGNGQKRLEWLKAAMLKAERDAGRMPAIILDESHNAAGDSNTNQRFLNLIGTEGKTGLPPVIYSSATFAKRAENMSIYYRVLPGGYTHEHIDQAVETHGETILELLSERLAEQGSVVRREHDLSNLTFRIITPNEDRVEGMRQRVDAAANVFEQMSYMAGDTDAIVADLAADVRAQLAELDEEDRKGNRMGVIGTNFGSRLFTICRQFNMALKTPVLIESALDTLDSGGRPVVVTEQTMEAAIRAAIADKYGDPAEPNGRIAAKDLTNIEVPNNFKVALRLLAHRLSSYKEVDSKGNVTVINLEGEKWRDAMESLEEAISRLPDDLPLSPLDTYQHTLEDAGWKFGLISRMSIGFDRDGKLYTKPDANVSDIVRRFRAGELDSVALTTAGATGISLHPTIHTLDQRPITLLELQTILDVNKRVQAQGRVNRTGQTSYPVIGTVTTGLAGEIREAAVQNNKMRSLSAATTSDRDNPALNREVPDMINSVGNRAACRYIRENPVVAERLGLAKELDAILSHPGEEEPVDLKPIAAISKLTGRVQLLTDDMQNALYETLKNYYFEIYQQMLDEGRDPFRTADLEWQDPRIEQVALYQQATDSSSPFGGPVMAYEISHRVEVTPISWDGALEKAGAAETSAEEIDEKVARVRAMEDVEFRKILGNRRTKVKQVVRGHESEAEAVKDRVAVTPDEIRQAVDIFLQDQDSGEGRILRDKRDMINTIADSAEALKPGMVVETNDPQDGSIKHGVIVDVETPDETRVLYPGQWRYHIAFAGEPRVQNLSLSQMLYRRATAYSQENYHARLAQDAFDKAPSGAFRDTRIVLTGNLFAAMSSKHSKGQLSYYIDPESGHRQRVILMPRSMSMRELMESAPVIPTAQIASNYIQTFCNDSWEKIAESGNPTSAPRRVKMCTDPRQFETQNDVADAVRLTVTMNPWDREDSLQCELTVPGTKARGGKFFLDKPLQEIAGEFRGTRTAMSVVFDGSKAEAVLRRLYALGQQFYVSGNFRDTLNRAMGVTDDTLAAHMQQKENRLAAETSAEPDEPGCATQSHAMTAFKKAS